MQPIPTPVSHSGRALGASPGGDGGPGIPSNSSHDRGGRAALSNRGGFKRTPMLGRGLALGIEFAAAVALFWWLGSLVDGWLGIEPWGQIVGSILGWIGGTFHVIVGAQRMEGPGARSKRGSER
jgi:Putative F0F1-ATPase subunit Ca2+/Mg2+ transporter